MTDLYPWDPEVPAVSVGADHVPEVYFEAVRYRPLDRTFSYITSCEANDAFYFSHHRVARSRTDRAACRTDQRQRFAPTSDSIVAPTA